jgi:DNA-binding transcriptional ArsR family regulator
VKNKPNQEPFIINDLDTLRVVSDPVRAQILELLIDHRLTVSDVAVKLGLSASKLYYHFNLLEKHGLIQVAETRQVANLIEKLYTARASYLSIDPALLTFSTGGGNEALISVVQTVIDATREDLIRSFQARAYNLESGAQEKKRQALINRVIAQIPDDKADELLERIRLLVDEFSSMDQTDAEKAGPGQTYALTVAFYPSFYFQKEHNQSTGESENSE